MAIIKAKAQQNTGVARVSENDDVYLRATRDGALFAANWKMAAIMEGRGFHANVGSLTTPITGGSTGNIIDLDRPSFLLSVPSGITVLPLRIEVCVGLPVGAADANEIDIMIAVDQDKAWASVGACTAVVPYNMNTLHSRATACTVRRTFTSNATAPVNDLELAHYTKVFTNYTTVGCVWTESKLVYEPVAPPIINGPAMMSVSWGGTAACQAFAAVQWLEYPTSNFT